ncbi:MAG: hypothetical protein mread185_000693 [Mycoplasmataceae bacterium]|nr:MAG: hypothetical protein mread185_000693 [Mycoplasmataceae bacterium]
MHEWLGHALVHHLFGGKIKLISYGNGPLLFEFGLGKTIAEIRLIPLSGFVRYGSSLDSSFLRFLVIAAGPLVHLFYVYLTYLILLKKPLWRENCFGYFLWWYGIRIGWIMILFMNFPFYLSKSDGTKIFKYLLGRGI